MAKTLTFAFRISNIQQIVKTSEAQQYKGINKRFKLTRQVKIVTYD